jgi:hypothetical protein
MIKAALAEYTSMVAGAFLAGGVAAFRITAPDEQFRFNFHMRTKLPGTMPEQMPKLTYYLVAEAMNDAAARSMDEGEEVGRRALQQGYQA